VLGEGRVDVLLRRDRVSYSSAPPTWPATRVPSAGTATGLTDTTGVNGSEPNHDSAMTHIFAVPR
jgi:hypothetical protein